MVMGPKIYSMMIHQCFISAFTNTPFIPVLARPTETGMADGEGFTLNIDLPKGSGDEQFIKGFSEELIPKMNDFKPEFIIISAGFDAYQNDLLGKLEYTDTGYGQVARIINNIANMSNSKGIMYMLEGGYIPSNIDNASQAIIKELINFDPH